LPNVVGVLQKVVQRYASSRILSFEEAHVFKTLQLIEKNGRISRNLLIKELGLGEGSIKTLVKHLKINGLIETSNAGMWMSEKGLKLYSKLMESIPKEIDIPTCSVGLGKFNHAILIKGLTFEIGSGIEQRDGAIRLGATGATTLLYKEGKFFMPGEHQDSLKSDLTVRKSILNKLQPKNKDVIIIGSANKKKIAELATKGIALQTVAKNHKHF